MKKKNKKMRVFYNLAVFGKEEKAAVMEALSSHMIVGGDKTAKFEKKIAKLFGKKHAVMVNSGSSANLLAFEILGLPEGSEVITPALTFGTTLSPIIQKRLKPVFVDVEERTYQIDAPKVENAITKKTKAMMIPSLIGNIPDLPKLKRLAKKHDLFLVEDSCDTLGAKINGKPTGVYSDISTTSFYAPHVITAAGNGGMICFDRDEWLDKVKMLLNWGRSSGKNESEKIDARFNIEIEDIPYDAKFVFEMVGYNFQTSELEASFALAQLKKFRKFRNLRKKYFKTHQKFFQKYKEYFELPKENPKADTCWLAYPLLVKKDAPFSRRDLVIFLEENGIQTRPLFTGNVLRQPAFKKLIRHQKAKSFPVADKVMKGSLVIGCHHGMDKEQMDYVHDKFEEFISQHSE